MIPIYQTSFGAPPGGNCLAACLASIFEVPIEEVDSEALRSKGTQQSALVEVCHVHGYQPFSYAPGGPISRRSRRQAFTSPVAVRMRPSALMAACSSIRTPVVSRLLRTKSQSGSSFCRSPPNNAAYSHD
jgi:hypothetical protein